jgi:hypothetical protein
MATETFEITSLSISGSRAGGPRWINPANWLTEATPVCGRSFDVDRSGVGDPAPARLTSLAESGYDNRIYVVRSRLVTGTAGRAYVLISDPQSSVF